MPTFQPHLQGETVTLFHGDCLDVLRELPDNSVDAVVTDPPYGLANTDPAHVAETIIRWVNGERDYLPAGAGFMGKAWDAFVPPVAVWDDCLRVLKPGGHVLAFAGSRTMDLMSLSMRLAGFEIRDSIAWLYGSGFPKSLDVSKAIDKARDDRPDILRVTTAIRDLRDEAGKTNRDLDDLFGFAGMAGHWTSTKSQPTVPTVEQWATLRDILSPPEWLDAEVWRLNGRKGTPGEAWESREVLSERVSVNHAGGGGWTDMVASGRFAAGEKVIRETAPATPAAEQWQGWGTALKPAFEPVVVGRKPLTGTVASNVQQWGTGALNIDGCRVGTDGGTSGAGVGPQGDVYGDGLNGAFGKPVPGLGRWPANVVLDESQAAALDEQSGTTTSQRSVRAKAGSVLGNGHTHGAFVSAEDNVGGFNDSGGASRFFYVAKAPKSERPRTDDGTAHPTVKPLALMRWLIRLVTPPGGTVLEPFAGSGTTVEACLLEGFNVVAIEREADYLPLIEARIARARPKVDEDREPDLFDELGA